MTLLLSYIPHGNCKELYIIHACNALKLELNKNQIEQLRGKEDEEPAEPCMNFMNAFEAFFCIGESFEKQ